MKAIRLDVAKYQEGFQAGQEAERARLLSDEAVERAARIITPSDEPISDEYRERARLCIATAIGGGK